MKKLDNDHDRGRTVSVIINNYNYARYVCEAIESTLAQTYPLIEIVIVDDGSTDESRIKIERYADRARILFKENGGQSSAFNSGFEASKGDIVIFLDADDVLYPAAVESAVAHFADERTVQVHWQLDRVGTAGKKIGGLQPSSKLAEGDLRDHLLLNGPDSWGQVACSGNAFARHYLQHIMPVPALEKMFNLRTASADAYLRTMVPLFGLIRRVNRPLGFYRVHDRNNYAIDPFDSRLDRDLRLYDHRCQTLAEQCRNRGYEVDIGRWKAKSWHFRLRAVAEDIARIIPPEAPFILVDEQQWGMTATPLRRCRSFIERDGRCWGPPTDDAAAIAQLERLRGEGIAFIVFGWPGFWWLEHYKEYRAHLDHYYRRVLKNDRLIIYDLRAGHENGGSI